MNTILRHNLRFRFTGELLATPNHRRLRRYTPLQKTLTELLHRMAADHPAAYATLTARRDDAVVIYGSAIGELAINMSQTAAIVADQLPLSPVAFQRSVLNASYSQCAIEHGITCMAIAMAKGFITTDAAIDLGDKLLEAGQCQHALVLVGAEHTAADHSAQTAEAQALWLTRSEELMEADQQLTELSYHPRYGKPEQSVGQTLVETDNESVAFWQPTPQRTVIDHRGQAYSSRWRSGQGGCADES